MTGVDRWLVVVARAAVIGAIASPLIVVDGAYFPYTIGRMIAFDRLAEIGGLAWIALLARGTAAPRASTTTLLVLSFAVWIALTSVTGAHPARSFASTLERAEGASSWLRAALLVLVAENVFAGAAARRQLSAAIAAVALCVVLPVLLAPAVPALAPTAAFGNNGLLAGFLVGLLPLAALLAIEREGGLARRALGLAATAAIAAAIGLLSSRAGLVGLVCGLAAGAAMLLRRPPPALIALAVLVVALPVAFAGTDPRGAAWQAGLAGILERPWLGWGIENFNLPFDRLRVGAAREPFFDRAHHAWLDAAIAGGIVALALHVAPTVLVLRGAPGIARKEGTARATAIVGGTMGKLAFGMFWFDQPITLLLFGLLLTRAFAPRELPIAVPAAAWRAPLAIGCCLAVALIWQSRENLHHSRAMGAALAAWAAHGGMPALPPVASTAFPVRQDLRLLAGDWMLRDMRDAGRIPDAQRLDAVIDGIVDFTREAPLDCRGPLLAGLLLEAAGRAEEAAPWRRRALALAPNHPALMPRARAVARR